MGDGSSINEFNFQSLIDPDMIEAEFVKGLELGIKVRKPKVYIDLNIFHLNYSNEISQVGALAARSYVPLRQNVEDSRRSGVETVIEYRPNNKVIFGMNGTYLSSNVDMFDNGSETFQNVNHVFSPSLILTPTLSYAASNRLRLHFSGRYVSQAFIELSNDREFVLPSYARFDTRLSYRLSDHTSISCMVNNLFNSTYYNDGAPVDLDFDGSIDGPGYRIQAPRSLFIQFRIEI